jgi:hypothetical protein
MTLSGTGLADVWFSTATTGSNSPKRKIRATAQLVLPIAVALVVVFGTELRGIVAEPTGWVRYTMYALGRWKTDDAAQSTPSFVFKIGLDHLAMGPFARGNVAQWLSNQGVYYVEQRVLARFEPFL